LIYQPHQQAQTDAIHGVRQPFMTPHTPIIRRNPCLLPCARRESPVPVFPDQLIGHLMAVLLTQESYEIVASSSNTSIGFQLRTLHSAWARQNHSAGTRLVIG